MNCATPLKSQTTQNLVESVPPSRLAWVEGIRIVAAVMVLLYHAQLLFTDYAYTPQPTGLLDNLGRMWGGADRLGGHWLISLLSTPIWFGFQAVDVFVLISGFTAVLALKGKPLGEPGRFVLRRFSRILWPYWTIAWFAYPVLWGIGKATQSYKPDLWHSFAGATFPLLFEFDGQLLLLTSGPWWFVPLILSFALVFPFLWWLMQRWGAKNLLIVSLAITFGYRALAVYAFGGHPTYVILDTPQGALPFIPFVAKLSSFVFGMVVAQAYQQGKGVIFWHSHRMLLYSFVIYGIGWFCQFSRFGWIFADTLLPIGLTGIGMVILQQLEKNYQIRAAMLQWGGCTYSFFLIHNFVVDRTIRLAVNDNLSSYYEFLPLMVAGTLILSVLADYTTPLIRQLIMAVLRSMDYVLTTPSSQRQRAWSPRVGDRVCYRGEGGWTVLQVGWLRNGKRLCLCQFGSDRTQWITPQELEPDATLLHPGQKAAQSTPLGRL